MRFILGRTLGIGRVSNAISYVEFQYGIEIDGVEVQHGTGLTPNTIATHLATLQECGLIVVGQHRSRKHQYVYHTYALNIAGMEAMAMAKLPEPRKARPRSGTLQPISKSPETRVSDPETATGKNRVTDVNNPSDCFKGITNVIPRRTIATTTTANGMLRTKRQRPNKSADTIDETLAKLRAGTPATEKAAQRGRPKKLTKVSLTNDWLRAYRTYYPDTPDAGLTVKTFMILSRAMAPLFATVSPADYFDWVCANWELLRRQKLTWRDMTGPAACRVPTLDDLCRFHKVLTKAYLFDHSAEVVNARKIEEAQASAQRHEAQDLKAENASLRGTIREMQQKMKLLDAMASAPVAPRPPRRPPITAERIAEGEDALRQDLPTWSDKK